MIEEEEEQIFHSRGKEMDKEQYHAAKVRLVAQMQVGQSWQVTAATAGVQTSQSTAYRLLQVVQKRGQDCSGMGEHDRYS